MHDDVPVCPRDHGGQDVACDAGVDYTDAGQFVLVNQLLPEFLNIAFPGVVDFHRRQAAHLFNLRKELLLRGALSDQGEDTVHLLQRLRCHQTLEMSRCHRISERGDHRIPSLKSVLAHEAKHAAGHTGVLLHLLNEALRAGGAFTDKLVCAAHENICVRLPDSVSCSHDIFPLFGVSGPVPVTHLKNFPQAQSTIQSKIGTPMVIPRLVRNSLSAPGLAVSAA